MFIGPWKHNGLEMPKAVLMLRYTRTQTSGVESLFDVYESEAHLSAQIPVTQINGPVAPYVQGEDSMRLAYWAMGLKHPELKSDQDVPAPSEAVLDALRGLVPETQPEEHRTWLQRIKAFFKLKL